MGPIAKTLVCHLKDAQFLTLVAVSTMFFQYFEAFEVGFFHGEWYLYLVIPPVFESCTRVLDVDDQKTARDLYWEAVAAGGGGEVGEKTEKLLSKSCEKNPFVGEPHVVLAQVYLGMERWEEAEREAEIGLRLMLEWGTGWDKRVTWEGWIAWARVLLMKAKEKDWPKNAWGILNLGLVR